MTIKRAGRSHILINNKILKVDEICVIQPKTPEYYTVEYVYGQQPPTTTKTIHPQIEVLRRDVFGGRDLPTVSIDIPPHTQTDSFIARIYDVMMGK
jgi:hypothetical protein